VTRVSRSLTSRKSASPLALSPARASASRSAQPARVVPPAAPPRPCATPARPPVYSFVTMEDGLFFSYLLSRQLSDGVVSIGKNSATPLLRYHSFFCALTAYGLVPVPSFLYGRLLSLINPFAASMIDIYLGAGLRCARQGLAGTPLPPSQRSSG
jgi:hypothetical protein